jgi:hypothetical protein
MVTISKPLSAGQAQSYHRQEFTAKEQNYWSQRGITAGEWQGRLASQFGLAGDVSTEDFARLQGQHPQTDDHLVRHERRMNISMPTARPSRRWNTELGPLCKTLLH